MSHIQHMARKRNVVQFFGTDCMAEKMAHEAIERHRVDDENALLRAENADLRRLLDENIQCLHATAAKLDELKEREAALVVALQRADTAHRIARARIGILEAGVAAIRSRTIESLSEIDSE